MSKGLGEVQRKCLAVLAAAGKMLDSIEVAGRAIDKRTVTEAESVSYRRALRKLAASGRIVDMGRGWSDKRRRWAPPEVAEAYYKRVGKAFGAKAEAMERKKK